MQAFDPDLMVEAKVAYENGENIISWAKSRLGIDHNTASIIQLSYDLQSGTYLEFQRENPSVWDSRMRELADFYGPFFGEARTVLDAGSGETNTFRDLMSRVGRAAELEQFASDSSWSRLAVGSASSEQDFLHQGPGSLQALVADTGSLPFRTKSIDVIMTDHSLEPNGGRLRQLLSEVFRVSRKFCMFTEPLDSLQDVAGLARMRDHGYIESLEESICALGGKVVARRVVKNNWNDLNRAVALVVEPPADGLNLELREHESAGFSVPGTDYPLMSSGAGGVFQSRLCLVVSRADGYPHLGYGLRRSRVKIRRFQPLKSAKPLNVKIGSRFGVDSQRSFARWARR